MNIRTPIIFAGLMVGFLPVLPAQELDPKQANDILRQLDDLHTQRDELMKKGVAGALQRIRAAASSDSAAKEFYEAAVMQTHFAGQGREQSQLREWKKKREDALKDKAFPTAVRLHLNYLALTLERASGKKNEDLLPALIQHAGLVQAFSEKLNSLDQKQRQPFNELLQKSVVEGVFSDWLRLKDHAGEIENWEMSAGNAEGIYSQSVLPILRANKDPQLLQYWDARIEREMAKAANSDLNFDAEKFSTVQLPRLRWQRALDEILLGQTSLAVTEMLALVKANPGHPEAETWIKQLTKIVEKTAKPPAAAETVPIAPEAIPSATPDTPAT